MLNHRNLILIALSKAKTIRECSRYPLINEPLEIEAEVDSSLEFLSHFRAAQVVIYFCGQFVETDGQVNIFEWLPKEQIHAPEDNKCDLYQSANIGRFDEQVGGHPLMRLARIVQREHLHEDELPLYLALDDRIATLLVGEHPCLMNVPEVGRALLVK